MATAFVNHHLDFQVQNREGQWVKDVDDLGELIYTPNREEAYTFNRKLLPRWISDPEHKVVMVGAEPEPILAGAAKGEVVNV